MEEAKSIVSCGADLSAHHQPPRCIACVGIEISSILLLLFAVCTKQEDLTGLNISLEREILLR